MFHPFALIEGLSAFELTEVRRIVSADSRGVTRALLVSGLTVCIIKAHLKEIWGWGAYSAAINRRRS